MLFPTLARFANRGEIDNLRATMANGMRQILFVLVPAAAAVLALSEPMIRLVYQRGAFDPAETTLVATALFWFAFSLPTNGLYLLQTRTFFSLQRPWMATGLAGMDLVVSTLAAWLLYKPFGVGGIVAGTGIGTTAAVVAQAVILRREFGGLEFGRLFSTTVRITIASAGPGRRQLRLSGTCSTSALGRGLAGQIVSLGGGLAAGGLVYLGGRKAAPDRRAGADHAPAAAPLDARPRPLPAGGRRAGAAGRLRLAGGRPRALAPAARFRGAPAHLATAVLALALLIWVAELLGTFGLFKPLPYLLGVAVVGLVALGRRGSAAPSAGGPGGVPAAGAPSATRGMGEPHPRRDPAGAGADPSTGIALRSPRSAVIHFAAGVRTRLSDGG